MNRYEQLVNDLAPKKFSWKGKAWMVFLVVVILVGLYSYTRQLQLGLVITDMRDYALWGVYISNFVFFVAISLVGSLVTAIFIHIAKTEYIIWTCADTMG